MSELDYKEVFHTEQLRGGGNDVGIKLLIAIDRPITQNDNKAFQKCIDDLKYALNLETFRLDPNTAETAKQQRESILSCFPETPIFVKEIPNQYDNFAGVHIPWYEVTSRIGVIVIGFRKRVVNIDWSKSNVCFKANDIFPKEGTTKNEHSIHAWDYLKVAEYLKRIFYVADNGMPEMHITSPSDIYNK